MKQTATFAARLRATREGAGLSQADAATILNVRSWTVSRWERGEAEPRGDMYRDSILAALKRAAHKGA
jgi:DNA-binding transcriptional regulator YiaG